MSDYVEICSIHESGASDSWAWSFLLARNEDGSFDFLLDQQLWDGEENAEPSRYELSKFRTGIELFEFLMVAWRDGHDEDLCGSSWEEVVNGIRRFDAPLADQVAQAIRSTRSDVERVETDKALQIQRCIKGATWSRQSFSGGGAMWAAIADRQRAEEAISAYVRAYYDQHGIPPVGEHQILERTVIFPNASSL